MKTSSNEIWDREEIHPWKLIEKKYPKEFNALKETLFSQANGYLGFRGTFEEGYRSSESFSMEGTYLNGFYERTPIHYDENAFGYATHSETMLNVPDGKKVSIDLDGEAFNFESGQIMAYGRELDFRTGLLIRMVTWKSPKGKTLQMKWERLVSFWCPNKAMLKISLTPLDFDGEITIRSKLDGYVKNQESGADPRFGANIKEESLATLDSYYDQEDAMFLQKTIYSDLILLCAMKNRLQTCCHYEATQSATDRSIDFTYKIQARRFMDIELEKELFYAHGPSQKKDEVVQLWKSQQLSQESSQWELLKKEQEEWLQIFWKKNDVIIDGNEKQQQGVRFNLFHLLQSTGCDGKTNVSAKGLTGEGYQGHYFWDTEIYIMPFFLYTSPAKARKLLEYRYYILPKARERARTLYRKKGALYPWRTIAGEECSSYYPAGTAQYHLNADIAYSIKKYWEATGDEDFMHHYGAEILMETARIWMYIGHFSPVKNGKFVINTVTGPDEYTAMVHNNYFTNLMASEHLNFAYCYNQRLKKKAPGVYKKLAEKIELDEKEEYKWKKASENMFFPSKNEEGIVPQDEHFLEKEKWNFHTTPAEHYPLLLHYHPLEIYRHQVCKQADLVLAMFLVHKHFTIEEKTTNTHYYDSITTHDSSLSTSIFSILYAEIGEMNKAETLFLNNIRMDLDNLHDNTHQGIHAAAMGGAWMCIVNGFAGMRTWENKISFFPRIPESWNAFEFQLAFLNNRIKVRVSKKETKYELLEGEGIDILHEGIPFTLTAKKTIKTMKRGG
ncbi:glycoside hydrolase family 65 protein [Tindallia californiensis]|uniref:Alpha,alpha-trehalose phosphorylase n=1 Tax=Tindallia californiensis TaxID=159292 RepID=A0A1H3I5W3_9FIRM|nr:glycosyl hydrolase family 65 protein [Tindallia californiensis]SDY23022.1 alpha,alpha-trehalose phosphorylase [Tindallia californiensis]